MDYPALYAKLYRLVLRELHEQVRPRLASDTELGFAFNGLHVSTMRKEHENHVVLRAMVSTGLRISAPLHDIVDEPKRHGNAPARSYDDRVLMPFQKKLPWLLGGRHQEIESPAPALPTQLHLNWGTDRHTGELVFTTQKLFHNWMLQEARLDPAAAHMHLLVAVLATFLADIVATTDALPVIDQVANAFKLAEEQSAQEVIAGGILTSTGEFFGSFCDYALTSRVEPARDTETGPLPPLVATLRLSWTSEDDPALGAIDSWNQAFGNTFNRLWERIRWANEQSNPLCASLWREVMPQQRHVVNVYSQFGGPIPRQAGCQREFACKALKELVDTSIDTHDHLHALARFYRQLAALALEKNGSSRTADDLVEITLA